MISRLGPASWMAKMIIKKRKKKKNKKKLEEAKEHVYMKASLVLDSNKHRRML